MFGRETFPAVLRDAHPVVSILSHSVTATSPIKRQNLWEWLVSG